MIAALRVELLRGYYPRALIALSILTSWVAIQNMPAAVVTWAAVSSAMLAGSHFVTPLLMGLGAWAVLRPRLTGYEFIQITSGLDGFRVRLVPILATSILGATIWGATFGVLVVHSLMNGIFGQPEPVTLLASLLFATTLPIIGHLVAAAIRNWVAIPLSVLLGVLGVAADSLNFVPGSLVRFTVLTSFPAIDGFVSNQLYFAAIGLQLLALTGLGLWLISLLSGVLLSSSWHLGLLSLSGLVTSVGLLLSQQGQPLIEVATPKHRTVIAISSGSGLAIETLEHYQPVHDDLMQTWQPIAVLFAGSELQFHELRQVVDLDHEGSKSEFGALYLDPHSASLAQDSIRANLIDIMSCYRNDTDFLGEAGLQGTIAVEHWLLEVAGVPLDPDQSETVGRFISFLRSMSVPEAQKWLADHTNNLKQCNWNIQDFRR